MTVLATLLTIVLLFQGLPETFSDSVAANIDISKLAGRQRREASTCVPKYASLPHHTMCFTDDPRSTQGVLEEEEKKAILDLHNTLRAGVKPSPTDMLLMTWDENIAQIATKWARQCVVGHDAGKSRVVPGYGVTIGQNVAGGFRVWENAIRGWYNEEVRYTYGEKPKKFADVGHYIQLVQNTTTRLGCGFAECPGSKYKVYFVCNYAVGNAGRPGHPYTAGEQCAACPNNCKDGLCDCQGKLCFNGGTLDPGTCTCTCQKIYSGPSCKTLTCPKKDNPHCGKKALPRDFCQTRPRSRFYCPYMCGLCQSSVISLPSLKANAPILEPVVPEPLFISSHNCTYSGQRPDKAVCLKYGRAGMDQPTCESAGGSIYGCDQCSSLPVRTRHCPVMCGTCDAPCGGKQCLNGGEMDTTACTCNCKGGFSGKLCDRAPCRGKTCRNGGTLDINTCTCACTKEFKGAICAGAKCARKKCLNGGVMNYDTCRCKCQGKFFGRYCGQVKCWGAKCSNGGTMNYNTCRCNCPREYIGRYCNALRCGKKKCSNDGVMNLKTCKCRCINNYSGKYCNRFVCPARDRFGCRQRTVTACGNGDTSDICPFMCNRCKAKKSWP